MKTLSTYITEFININNIKKQPSLGDTLKYNVPIKYLGCTLLVEDSLKKVNKRGKDCIAQFFYDFVDYANDSNFYFNLYSTGSALATLKVFYKNKNVGANHELPIGWISFINDYKTIKFSDFNFFYKNEEFTLSDKNLMSELFVIIKEVLKIY